MVNSVCSETGRSERRRTSPCCQGPMYARARRGSGPRLQMARVRGHRAQDDIEAVTGRIGEWIRKALLADLAGEYPVLGDRVWASAPVVEAEASAAGCKPQGEAMRRGASEELASPWDAPSVDQHGPTECTMGKCHS